LESSDGTAKKPPHLQAEENGQKEEELCMKMSKNTEPKKTEFQTAKNTPLSFRRSHCGGG
jgi:hypothetical protein